MRTAGYELAIQPSRRPWDALPAVMRTTAIETAEHGQASADPTVARAAVAWSRYLHRRQRLIASPFVVLYLAVGTVIVLEMGHGTVPRRVLQWVPRGSHWSEIGADLLVICAVLVARNYAMAPIRRRIRVGIANLATVAASPPPGVPSAVTVRHNWLWVLRSASTWLLVVVYVEVIEGRAAFLSDVVGGALFAVLLLAFPAVVDVLGGLSSVPWPVVIAIVDDSGVRIPRFRLSVPWSEIEEAVEQDGKVLWRLGPGFHLESRTTRRGSRMTALRKRIQRDDGILLDLSCTGLRPEILIWASNAHRSQHADLEVTA